MTDQGTGEDSAISELVMKAVGRRVMEAIMDEGVVECPSSQSSQPPGGIISSFMRALSMRKFSGKDQLAKKEDLGSEVSTTEENPTPSTAAGYTKQRRRVNTTLLTKKFLDPSPWSASVINRAKLLTKKGEIVL